MTVGVRKEYFENVRQLFETESPRSKSAETAPGYTPNDKTASNTKQQVLTLELESGKAARMIPRWSSSCRRSKSPSDETLFIPIKVHTRRANWKGLSTSGAYVDIRIRSYAFVDQ